MVEWLTIFVPVVIVVISVLLGCHVFRGEMGRNP